MQLNRLVVRKFGVLPYRPVWQLMKEFATDKAVKSDEIWLLQHEPVYTKGMRCKEQPFSQGQYIPLIAVDRGGLMTYHGPGQLIAYCLVNLPRKKMNIKQIVFMLEQAVINFLEQFSIVANRVDGAPGVYLDKKKIASIGLRVRNQTTYHGLSINFDMDLQPFEWINPCGFKKLEVVQLKDLVNGFDWSLAQQMLTDELIELFGYEKVSYQTHNASFFSFARKDSSLSTVPMSIHSPA